MKNLEYGLDQVLTWEGVDLAYLAKKFGTPLWVYSADQIRENYCKIQAAFSGLDAGIRYAVKANDSLQILSILNKNGSGFDVVSGGELSRVCKIGADRRKIVFAGAAKTDEEIEDAIIEKIGLINAESLDELKVIDTFAYKMKVRPKVALRVAPGIDPHTDAHISTGHIGTKFGIEYDEAAEILNLYNHGHSFTNIDIVGIHCHIGSQIHNPIYYADALDRIFPLFKMFKWLKILDLGGGLPVAYGGPEDESVLSFDRFSKVISEKFQEKAPLGLQVLIEPGRSIVADAGLLIVEVQSSKMSGGHRIVTCDGGMADLVRPAMYGSHHVIKSVKYGINTSIITDIAGPHCESSDFLGKDRYLPELGRGDFLVIENAGAYGQSMSSRYNSSRFSAAVMIDGVKAELCRVRESYEESWINEHWK